MNDFAIECLSESTLCHIRGELLRKLNYYTPDIFDCRGSRHADLVREFEDLTAALQKVNRQIAFLHNC